MINLKTGETSIAYEGLKEGFFFDEVLLDDKLHSDFFGKELIVKDLVTEDVYRLPFLGETYYDIISKDMILIDFSVYEY